MTILLSEALHVARITQVEARGASDGELLALWRRRHPHAEASRPRPYPSGRLLAVGWCSEDDRLHVRFLPPRSAPSQIRLTSAVVELVVRLVAACWDSSRQLPAAQRHALQLAAVDRLGEPVTVVWQSPAPARIIGRCRLPVPAR